MKNFFTNTIIKQAIELGFDFEQFDTETELSEINQSLQDFFNENAGNLEQIEDECEITGNGSRQNVVYSDFVSSGQIVDFSAHWHKSPETKVFHSNFITVDSDGLVKQMNLYYLVGETDYNK